MTSFRFPRPLLGALGLVVVVAAPLLAATPGPAGAQAAPAAEAKPGRVLVVSLPGVAWNDVADEDLPALRGFLEGAALADLAPRGVHPRSGPGDAYLTIAAGSRAATEPLTDGQVLAVGEESTGTPAGDIFARRTGTRPDGPFVSLTWPTLVKVNRSEPYDAVLGSLGASLAKADVATAVIGNADGTDSIGPSYERQAGLALAEPNGVVPGGELGRSLLSSDPSSPFGLHLDEQAVVDAFAAAWDAPAAEQHGAVVMVEASDLARTLRYRGFVDGARYRQLWDRAMADSDRLLGRLLDHVDPERDTVLVVSPYNRRGDRDLTIAALRGPGTVPGYLRSASTQRPGFLTLVDIAPTILDRLDLPRPEDMEGRPAIVSPSSRSLDGRIAHLVDLNRASRFREQLLDPTTIAALLGMAVVVAGGMATFANRWGAAARGAVRFVALVSLTILPGSYVVRLLDIEDRGVGFYWLALLAFALVIPVALTVLGRLTARPRLPLLVVLALMATVLVVDVVTGSNLSLSAAFGYSATGNSRLYGISNYSYGQLTAAACLLATWVASRRPDDRRARWLAVGLMFATLVVLGVPTWGSDVGGTLAFTPAVALFGAKVFGRRIRLRTLAVGVLATAAAILASGFLDLARPANDRSHLGRLFERVGREGLEPLFSIMERKLLANLQVSTSSLWVVAIPVFVVLWVFLVRFPGRPLELIRRRLPQLGAGLAAALVAGGLGSAVNDSGAIIGGITAMVVGCALVDVLLEQPAPARPTGDDPVEADPTPPTTATPPVPAPAMRGTVDVAG